MVVEEKEKVKQQSKRAFSSSYMPYLNPNVEIRHYIHEKYNRTYDAFLTHLFTLSGAARSRGGSVLGW